MLIHSNPDLEKELASLQKTPYGNMIKNHLYNSIILLLKSLEEGVEETEKYVNYLDNMIRYGENIETAVDSRTSLGLEKANEINKYFANLDKIRGKLYDSYGYNVDQNGRSFFYIHDQWGIGGD